MTDADRDRRPGEEEGFGPVVAQGVDDDPTAGNARRLTGWQRHVLWWACVGYTAFHLITLNMFPLETWAFRIAHVAGALVLGYALTAAWSIDRGPTRGALAAAGWLPLAVAGIAGAAALGFVVWHVGRFALTGAALPPDPAWGWWGQALTLSVVVAILASWVWRGQGDRVFWTDWVLAAGAVSVAAFFLGNLDAGNLRMRAGTPFAAVGNFWAALAGVLLILELTRRVAGLALVIIAIIFIFYSFAGPWLPGFLEHSGFAIERFFTYVYTDNGILGPTTAVSSTYIILFITFAAFLQASKVGDYFVNFAFAAAGRARGGPAKVAIFASGLMGMINGTSAGNVVATGSLTIPLMKKVGYRSRSAGAIEAAASTGGQIMPPIMGAGAFIMAEITAIPYTDIVIAAIIPAVLYFISVYFMVDLEATKMGMRGMREDELPKFAKLVRQVYLFVPIIILIGALFVGYSVIRAGTLATAAAAVVSWLTPFRMGPVGIARALELAARMSIQIIAVCACAGVIVGVIALTGVGARFSSLLLGIATSEALPPQAGLLLAMIFAMGIAIILGMGMPTTAAYAVAASVVAPGLGQIMEPSFVAMGVEDPDRLSRLTAHFFVFYFAVISAITPPVALASYAAAGISGADPMRTSVTSFKIGLAAFIVPFIFFYSPAMLMEGTALRIVHVGISASIGVYLLSAAVQGWFFGRMNAGFRGLLLLGALSMIAGGWMTDLAGIGIGLALFLWQRRMASRQPVAAGE
ncbi:MAG: TRAP transporter fused permease subunit [Alphaproteobacteria bacterium]|jgi:TRAP transporter 4TM/12TM fusion protein|nr:TRAP transporter fused permease subunit [Alphaproteobacteria bacterium]